jgi:hypothetical protein
VASRAVLQFPELVLREVFPGQHTHVYIAENTGPAFAMRAVQVDGHNLRLRSGPGNQLV